jgi:hypothetical protein
MINLQNKEISPYTRNSIYKLAKQIYIETGFCKTGMCYACIKALHEYGVHIHKNNFNDLYVFLPELLMVKPKNRRDYFWWEVNQVSRRLNAFNKMIKLTE